MNNRFKWFTITPFAPRHLKKLLGKLAENSYSEDSGRGFVVDELREKRADLRYIERSNIIETVQSPLGGHTDYEMVTYSQCSFSLSVAWPQCEIREGFRSTTKVLNLIASYLDFGIAIEEQQIPLGALIGVLKRSVPAMRVVSVIIADLQVDGHSSARVELSSTEDAFARVKWVTQTRGYHLERIKLTWHLEGQECVCSVTSDGRCSIAAHDAIRATDVIKDAIGKASEPG